MKGSVPGATDGLFSRVPRAPRRGVRHTDFASDPALHDPHRVSPVPVTCAADRTAVPATGCGVKCAHPFEVDAVMR
jgi:hypothetical protein